MVRELKVARDELVLEYGTIGEFNLGALVGDDDDRPAKDHTSTK